MSNYPYEFEKIKKLIIKRDKNKCQMGFVCNGKDYLIVHHIDRNKKNNNFNNLITLCNGCHMFYHFYFDEKRLNITNKYCKVGQEFLTEFQLIRSKNKLVQKLLYEAIMRNLKTKYDFKTSKGLIKAISVFFKLSKEQFKKIKNLKDFDYRWGNL